MKLKKHIACILGICLMLTGCGRAPKPSSESDSTTETVTEEFYDTEELSPIQETVTEFITTAPVTAKAETTAVTASSAVTTVAQTQKIEDSSDSVNNDDSEEPADDGGSDDDNSYEPQQQSYEPAVTTNRYVHTTAARRTTAVRTTTTVTTTTINHDPSPNEVLNELSLEQKVGQMFMVTPEAITGISPMREVGNGTKMLWRLTPWAVSSTSPRTLPLKTR